MPWLSLLVGLIGLSSTILKIVVGKKLMDAGAAEAIGAGLEELSEQVSKAVAARRAANAANSQPGGLRKPDGHKRD